MKVGKWDSFLSAAMNKILYWGEYTGFSGGIERYAFQTAGALREAGLQVDYVGPVKSRNSDEFAAGFNAVPTPAEAFASSSQYDLAILHKICTPDTLAKLRSIFGERLLFLAHDHDLYCPRCHYYTPFGRTNCHRSYSPLRCNLCAMLSHPKHWKKHFNAPLLSELSQHRAIVISSFMKENLLRNGFAPQNVDIIHTFIDTKEPKTYFLADGILKIIFVAQLIRGKGCDLLLDVLSRLKRPFHATILGDGGDKSMLEAKANELGIASNVTFTGWVTNPEDYVRQADLAVYPFRWQEPFGLCGLEAAANGIPVIAFNVGGVAEWLHDGVNGILIPHGDIDAMANAIENLTSETLKEMSSKATAFTKEQFSKEMFISKFNNLIS